jgi:hypothetical protein
MLVAFVGCDCLWRQCGRRRRMRCRRVDKVIGGLLVKRGGIVDGIFVENLQWVLRRILQAKSSNLLLNLPPIFP